MLKRGLTVDMDSELFIGMDTSKLKISVAVADGRRHGEVRFYGYLVGSGIGRLDGEEAGEAGYAIAFLLRSGADWIRALSANL